ncbi:hypothetical protein LG047_15170 [Methylocystis sp. WRRC1]|uniref:hypothetical protein n=1 Tax=Methylocystis sp. WRRC1 TaxID=1732014 RepID=UPI001D15349E|nr:hypothetical protein [Methylocystis sp. WRRC1]MCC3246641.1 hypothetical protein [Methylocystis sp. WRRC1]
MTDLVKRLRDEATFNFPICGEAADRIEALECNLQEAALLALSNETQAQQNLERADHLAAEIEQVKRDRDLAFRREDTARKFWIRDAKEALIGKPQALRNRVELCELPPVRAEKCPVDGMPLLVFEDEKREHEEKARADHLAAILRRVCEAADDVSSFAWSAVTADCNESAEYLNTVIRSLRAAIAEAKKELGE